MRWANQICWRYAAAIMDESSSLPENWRAILKECDFGLAARQLRRAFEVWDAEAKEMGGSYDYEPNFLREAWRI